MVVFEKTYLSGKYYVVASIDRGAPANLEGQGDLVSREKHL